MTINILFAGKNYDAALQFVAKLNFEDVIVESAITSESAIKKIKNRDFDLILFGDVLEGSGDTLDVALAMKGVSKNRTTVKVCVGSHKGRAAKLHKQLKPYALLNDGAAIETVKRVLKEKSELSVA